MPPRKKQTNEAPNPKLEETMVEEPLKTVAEAEAEAEAEATATTATEEIEAEVDEDIADEELFIEDNPEYDPGDGDSPDDKSDNSENKIADEDDFADDKLFVGKEILEAFEETEEKSDGFDDSESFDDYNGFDESDNEKSEEEPSSNSSESRKDRIAANVHRNKRRSGFAIHRRDPNRGVSIGIEQKLLELTRLKKSEKATLEGNVYLITPIKSRDREIYCVGVKVDGYEEFTFYVPLKEFDFFEYRKLNDDKDKLNILREVIGAKIHLAVTTILRDDKIVICSHKEANRRLRRKYFYQGYKLRRDLASSKKRFVYTGTATYANIIQVSAGFLIAESFGAQYRIHVPQLCFHQIDTLRKIFHAGESIPVRLTDVELINDHDFNVKIEANHVEMLNNTAEKALKEAKVGDITLGTITRIDYKTTEPRGQSESGYNFSAKYFRRNRYVRVGSVVSIRVISKVYDKRNCYAIVDIIDVISF